jgi:hypothetical protein
MNQFIWGRTRLVGTEIWVTGIAWQVLCDAPGGLSDPTEPKDPISEPHQSFISLIEFVGSKLWLMGIAWLWWYEGQEDYYFWFMIFYKRLGWDVWGKRGKRLIWGQRGHSFFILCWTVWLRRSDMRGSDMRGSDMLEFEMFILWPSELGGCEVWFARSEVRPKRHCRIRHSIRNEFGCLSNLRILAIWTRGLIVIWF